MILTVAFTLVTSLGEVISATSSSLHSPSPSPSPGGPTYLSQSPSQQPSASSQLVASSTSSCASRPSVSSSAFPFPPQSWLGFGLDFTQTLSPDLFTITKAVLTSERFITLDSQTTNYNVNGVTYSVPDNVYLSSFSPTGTSLYVTYPNGTAAAQSIIQSPSIFEAFFAVSYDPAVFPSVTRVFHAEYMYANFVYNQPLYQTTYTDYAGYIDNAGLKSILNPIPPFSTGNSTIVGLYKNFFNKYGSHVIVGTKYGAALIFYTWASDTLSDVIPYWSTDVTTSYYGLNNNGQYDNSVRTTKQYNDFSNKVQKTFSCSGGDPTLAEIIVASPNNATVYTTFQKWVATAQASPSISKFQITSLWSVMQTSQDPVVVARANDIQSAFQWISIN